MLANKRLGEIKGWRENRGRGGRGAGSGGTHVSRAASSIGGLLSKNAATAAASAAESAKTEEAAQMIGGLVSKKTAFQEKTRKAVEESERLEAELKQELKRKTDASPLSVEEQRRRKRAQRFGEDGQEQVAASSATVLVQKTTEPAAQPDTNRRLQREERFGGEETEHTCAEADSTTSAPAVHGEGVKRATKLLSRALGAVLTVSSEGQEQPGDASHFEGQIVLMFSC